MQFVTLRVTQWFFVLRWIEVRLKSPFRPSATYFDGAKVGTTRNSVSGPTSPCQLRRNLVVCTIAFKKHFCANTFRQCMTSRRGCHVTQEPHA
ncbi:hypothetical protein CXB38_21420 [Pseudomonas syringae]|nr:hypothetical protein CXB35_23315 [Pseudomonas syringae]POP79659.1 hypothetical protein CXB38_21420 [Pseudomonas syringae]